MTLEITSVVAANGGAEVRVTVLMREGERSERRTLTLLTCQYASLRPTKGEIDTAYYDRLSTQATICEAVMRGMGMLSYGACSERGLMMKLRAKGYEPRIAKAASAYLARTGYIREEEDATREAERCVKKLWGRKRIAALLLEKGYGDEAINAALATLSEDILTKNCVLAAQKRFSKPPKESAEKKKAFDALCRLGYSTAQIQHALSILEDRE